MSDKPFIVPESLRYKFQGSGFVICAVFEERIVIDLRYIHDLFVDFNDLEYEFDGDEIVEYIGRPVVKSLSTYMSIFGTVYIGWIHDTEVIAMMSMP